MTLLESKLNLSQAIWPYSGVQNMDQMKSIILWWDWIWLTRDIIGYKL